MIKEIKSYEEFIKEYYPQKDKMVNSEKNDNGHNIFEDTICEFASNVKLLINQKK